MGKPLSTDLVTYRGEHAVVVVQPQPAVDGGQLILAGSEEHTEAHVDHLQVLAPRGGRQELGPGTDIIDDGIVEPRRPAGRENRGARRREEGEGCRFSLQHRCSLGDCK